MEKSHVMSPRIKKLLLSDSTEDNLVGMSLFREDLSQEEITTIFRKDEELCDKYIGFFSIKDSFSYPGAYFMLDKYEDLFGFEFANYNKDGSRM